MSTEAAYLRVSSTDQNLARQRDIVTDSMKVFEDKCSGSTTNRPGLTALLDWVRAGDTVHVHSIDRMARDLMDLQALVNTFKEKGVTLVFHKESLRFTADGSDSMSVLMLQIFGAVAQFERARIRERQAEGIAKARAAGKYTGGHSLPEKTVQAVLTMKADGRKATEIARELTIGRSTVYKVLKENTTTPATEAQDA